MQLSRVATAALVLFLAAFIPVEAVVQPNRDASQGHDHSRFQAQPPATRQRVVLEIGSASHAAGAAREFLARHGGQWTFTTDPRTGHAALVQGSGVPIIPGRGNDLGPERWQQLGIEVAAKSGRGLRASVDPKVLDPEIRTFIEQAQALLVPESGSLVFNERFSVARDEGRLISFYYDWMIDGVRVEGARVFVRLNAGNITQFGTHLVGPIDLATQPSIQPGAAWSRLLQETGDGEVARPSGEPELLIQVEGDRVGGLRYRLVWKLSYTIFGQIEAWEGRVDAVTGDVVGFRDTTLYARAVGGIWAETPFESEEIRMPLADLDIDNAGTTLITDGGGSIVHPGGAVSSQMTGRFFSINCQGCTTPEQPFALAEIGSGWLDFGVGGTDEIGNGLSTRADRTTFYHLNRIRRLALEWLPNTGFSASLNFEARTNIDSVCNATFAGSRVNFFRAGGGCNNTGEIADVIRHEWGHGLDLDTMPGDGGTGEGTADVVALHMSHDSRIGPGFRITGAPVRDVDKAVTALGAMTLSRIDNGDCNLLPNNGLSPHCVGQVYGQSAWDLAQLLRARHGHHTGWRTSEKIFFTSLPDAETYDPASAMSIYGAYINADDDDGNLANGTPNGDDIFAAFSGHEIAQAAVGASPECARPAQPTLTVTPNCTAFNLSWNAVPGAVRYDILRAELREDTAYLKVGETTDATLFTDTAVAIDVDYWYTVMAVNALGCESTVELPETARLTPQPILDISAVVVDDAPLGNRSGGADPGETVDLVVTLDNVGLMDATDPTGRIFVSTAGVTLLEDQAPWPSTIASGTGADNVGSLSIQLDEGIACGTIMEFQLLPTDVGSSCTSRINTFDVPVGTLGGETFVCDETPPCFTEPTFAGLESALSGASCGQTQLAWQPAESNCTNATITYNVYRSTDPGFIPGADELIAEGLASTTFADDQLEPGVTYHYVVRPNDSRSGEADSVVQLAVVSPSTPDTQAPLFSGAVGIVSGDSCGETQLAWGAAQETCSLPVAYEIYRSTDPDFVPGPENQIGSSLGTTFVDAALTPGEDYTYIVQARDAVGNQDTNGVRVEAAALTLDLPLTKETFEADDAGWTVVAPNDATAGAWEWGDPDQTSYQPENDATPDPGVNCWITGLGPLPSNGDVDGGTTTLLSATYDLQGSVNPAIRYARWFTNDLGASPGDLTDALLVEISNDNGATWTQLDSVGPGTPLDWVPVEHALDGVIVPTSEMRFRFTAADLGSGSLVEAGVDDFEFIDLGQGCGGCSTPVQRVTSIHVDLAGDDVVVDFSDSSADPVSATRYVVYKLTGPQLTQAVRIGTTTTKTFVHEGAALADESFRYRVSAVDACGQESLLK